jgi:hypothetical protein
LRRTRVGSSVGARGRVVGTSTAHSCEVEFIGEGRRTNRKIRRKAGDGR